MVPLKSYSIPFPFLSPFAYFPSNLNFLLRYSFPVPFLSPFIYSPINIGDDPIFLNSITMPFPSFISNS